MTPLCSDMKRKTADYRSALLLASYWISHVWVRDIWSQIIRVKDVFPALTCRWSTPRSLCWATILRMECLQCVLPCWVSTGFAYNFVSYPWHYFPRSPDSTGPLRGQRLHILTNTDTVWQTHVCNMDGGYDCAWEITSLKWNFVLDRNITAVLVRLLTASRLHYESFSLHLFVCEGMSNT